MLFLSVKDAKELYDAVAGNDEIQKVIGPDGERLTGPDVLPAVTVKQALVIWDALKKRLAQIENGFFGGADSEWAPRVKQIIAAVGTYGLLLAQHRLFCGVYPCALVFADRSQEEYGDYKRLASLPYDTLELELKPDCPPDLVDTIKKTAANLQAKRGQHYAISSSGNSTVVLGSKLSA